MSGKTREMSILLITMEFPPEIVSIIRQYSLPCFKYFREYKRILCLKGLSEWPALREMLQKNPGAVLPAMLSFETAHHVFEPMRSFYAEDPEWFHAELELDFYHKQTDLMYCETMLSRLIESRIH